MFRDSPDLIWKDRSARSRLHRIAAVLEVPVNAFTTEDARQDDGANEAQETLELVRLFSAVREPEVRRRCLSFVRAVATEALLPPGRQP